MKIFENKIFEKWKNFKKWKVIGGLPAWGAGVRPPVALLASARPITLPH